MPTATNFLGIEIGGTKLQLVKADANGNLVQMIRYAIDPAAGATRIRQQIRESFDVLHTADNVAAIGVGFGGPVDYRSGTICVSHQVGGWNDFDLVHWLQQLTGLPVVIENDANAAALAEAIHGSGKGYKSVFYMTIGSGIGGGMVINGQLYRGCAPGEVEVGHLRLNKNGKTLEDRCSGWAVNRLVREAILQYPESLLAQLAASHRGPEAVLLQPALEGGDAVAQQLIDSVADDLAFGLSHVVHLFHPELLVIGGGLSQLHDHLLLPIRKQLPKYVMKAFLPPPPLSIASLGENVVPLGAIELAKQVWLTQQLPQTV